MKQNFYFIYVDESYDEKSYAYSAIFVDAFKWNSIFNSILKWRKEWFANHQIPLDDELHATDFVGGRGSHPTNRNKDYRAGLFYEAIGHIETMDVKIMNAITSEKKRHLKLFEYMLNRIENTLKHKFAWGAMICDEGNENKLTGLVRRMKKNNTIPSQYWQQGASDINIPLDRIIEDPLFKQSKSSYFIQLADFLAFSLLRSEKPLHSQPQKIREAFNLLDKTLIREATRKDPRGIIRA